MKKLTVYEKIIFELDIEFHEYSGASTGIVQESYKENLRIQQPRDRSCGNKNNTLI